MYFALYSYLLQFPLTVVRLRLKCVVLDCSGAWIRLIHKWRRGVIFVSVTWSVCVKLGFQMIVQIRSISTWQGLWWSLSAPHLPHSRAGVEKAFFNDQASKRSIRIQRTTSGGHAHTIQNCPTIGRPIFRSMYSVVQIPLREIEAVLCWSHNPLCCQWTTIVHVPRLRQNAAPTNGILHRDSSLWQPCWPIPFSRKQRPNGVELRRQAQQEAHSRCPGSPGNRLRNPASDRSLTWVPGLFSKLPAASGNGAMAVPCRCTD